MDKRARKSWLGRLERMDEERMPKKFWKGRGEGEDSGKDEKKS